MVSAIEKINRFNYIRLACASVVLFSHLDWFAGNPEDRFRSLGLYAVAIFFGLSGFLLTKSIFTKGAGIDFIKNRFLRIFPGFWINLAITALVFVPIYNLFSKSNTGFTIDTNNIIYVLSDMTTRISKFQVANELQNAKVKMWNPSLWTLIYELTCYFALFIFFKIFKSQYIKFLYFFVPANVLLYLTYLNFFNFRALNHLGFTFYYFSFFFFGSLLSTVEIEKIERNIRYILACSFVAILMPVTSVTPFFNQRDLILGLVLIPLALWLSINPRVKKVYINDYSFGIYIYGGPATQLILIIFPELKSNWLFLAAFTLTLTFILSFLSWHLIEKQCLKLKR